MVFRVMTRLEAPPSHDCLGPSQFWLGRNEIINVGKILMIGFGPPI